MPAFTSFEFSVPKYVDPSQKAAHFCFGYNHDKVEEESRRLGGD